MKKGHSLKVKMTLWFVFLGVLLTALTGMLSLWVGQSISTGDVRKKLETAVRERASALNDRLCLPDSIDPGDGIAFAIIDKKGNTILGEIPGSGDLPKPDSKNFAQVTLDGSDYIVYDKKVTISYDKVYVRGVIAAPDQDTVFRNTITAWFWMLPVLAILLAVGGYLIVRRSLSPLEKLAASTSAIMDGRDLSRSIAYPKGRDEVYELTGTINQMLDRLEESFAGEKRLISDASHELRTPTAVILAQCEVLESEKTDPTLADYQEGIATIHRQAERMKRLVTDLLEFSRIDRSAVEKRYESLDAGAILESVCEEQREIHGENIELRCKTEPNLIAELNGSLFIRLLVNLISNAYQYGRDGGHIEVSLTAGQRVDLRPMMRLSVKDDGIGIAPEHQKKVWERFYRVDASRTDNGSSGLGLPMVKWIVSYHGGTVRLISEEGKGSEFIVELPLRQS